MNNDEPINTIDFLTPNFNAFHAQLQRHAGYLARNEINELIEKIKLNPHRLEPYGYKVYSQNDEDGILNEIFKRINVEKGSFCEIGVENGLECNSLYLIHKGWRGIWFEGDQAQKQAIENKFYSLLNNERLVLGIGFITPENINEHLEKSLDIIDLEVNNLDFLSIDIDGMDIYLLEALKYQPKVICIEYNAKFPPPLFKKPVYDPNFYWQGTDYFGSSLVALNEVAKAKGYTLVATNITGCNAFFVRNDLANNKFDSRSSPESLYNPPRYYLWYDHYLNQIGHMADFGLYTDLL